MRESKNSEELEDVKIDLEQNEKEAVDVRESWRGGGARDVTRDCFIIILLMWRLFRNVTRGFLVCVYSDLAVT